jgi:hypothetical protein
VGLIAFDKFSNVCTNLVIYIHIYKHTHTHTYIYICVCVLYMITYSEHQTSVFQYILLLKSNKLIVLNRTDIYFLLRSLLLWSPFVTDIHADFLQLIPHISPISSPLVHTETMFSVSCMFLLQTDPLYISNNSRWQTTINLFFQSFFGCGNSTFYLNSNIYTR